MVHGIELVGSKIIPGVSARISDNTSGVRDLFSLQGIAIMWFKVLFNTFLSN